MAALIEIVSDVVCPWCYIGKRRLERALQLLDRSDVEVRWKPFELNPGAPAEGMDRRTYRARKFGSLAYAQQLEDQVAAAGAGEGIHFRFDRIARVPNTFHAHRLIWEAGRSGVQDQVVEDLFHAYFLEGQDVGDPDVLAAVARNYHLEFAGDEGAEEVSAELARARDQGVTGVPTFFVEGRPVISGAQAPRLLAETLGQAFHQCSLTDGTCNV
jgi:predicted DsbA family dithiol-disulfide isomerase